MSTIKEKGLVIKENFLNESDKVVTLLMKGYGKVTVYSKGARNIKSKFLAGTQMFCYSEFVLYKGATFISTAQIDLIESFYAIRTDYDSLCFGTYYFEFIDKLVLENSPCDDMLRLVLKILSRMKKKSIKNELAYCIFNIKMLELNGYKPSLSRCVCCSKQTSSVYINEEGIICSDCIKNTKSIKLRHSSITALDYIINSGIDTLFNFDVNSETLSELLKISELLVSHHLELNISSKKYLNFI